MCSSGSTKSTAHAPPTAPAAASDCRSPKRLSNVTAARSVSPANLGTRNLRSSYRNPQERDRARHSLLDESLLEQPRFCRLAGVVALAREDVPEVVIREWQDVDVEVLFAGTLVLADPVDGQVCRNDVVVETKDPQH